MRAIRIHAFGGPDVLVLEEAPEPRAGAEEIRIRVMAAGVNPADWKIREQGREGLPLPLTLGLDVAGVVDQVGEVVRDFAVGDHVFAKVPMTSGGYAEYAVAPASAAAKMPKRMSFVEAAAVPTAGLTAWQALFDTAHLQAGQTVLVHGGAGGVGSFAIQFAKWKGARVLTTAASDHRDFVQSLGADEVIDYTEVPFEEVACGVDVVIDTIGGDTLERSWRTLKPGGHLVTLVGSYDEGTPAKYGVQASRILGRGDGRELAQIAELIDQGVVTPRVTVTLPLAEARRAHEMSATHHQQGKIVLVVADEAQQEKAA